MASISWRNPHRRCRFAEAALLLAVLGACPLRAHALDRHYLGVASAENGSAVRYREEHWLFRADGVATRLVLYRCPSGEPFARKLVYDRGDPAAPDFDFEDGRDGYREGVRREGERWLVYARERGDAPMQTRLLQAVPDMVVDAGFDAYVREHWASLAGAARRDIAFVMPSRQDYLRLRLGDARDAWLDGVAVRRFRLGLGGLLGALAPAIDLTYTMDGHLLRFEGIGTIRDERGRHAWVRIDFPRSLERAAPQPGEVAAARTVPLVTRCGA